MRKTLLATAIVAAALGWGRPSAQAQEAASARAVHMAFLRQVHRVLGPRATRRVLEQLHGEAKAATAVHVRGRAHLSGRIVTSRFVVERGAEVTIEPGTVIYVAGDMTIEAPIVMTRPASVRAKGDVGANGQDVEDVALLCAGDGTIASELVGTKGGNGETANVGSVTKGGDGGKGGGFAIGCKGPLTVSGTISPGAGGAGGSASAEGPDGFGPVLDGTSASAAGGKGGDAGDVKIAAPSVSFTNPDGSIDIADGGAGGFGAASGGNGAPSADRGGNGGNAKARGGDAGKGTVASIRLLDKAGSVTGQARTVASRSVGAPGGLALASGGYGSSSLDRSADGCPAAGLAGGGGGRGGNATALAGKGGQAPILKVKGGAATPASEGVPGNGGRASANASAGGRGGNGQTAKQPGRGGKGGDSGKARAVGGEGGGAKSVAGGAGGEASTSEAVAGSGGNGGDCCDRPGGKGAPGGDPGSVGRSQPVAGRGGKGNPEGPDGTVSLESALPSASGARGADCAGGGGGGGITYSGPLTDVRLYSSGGNADTWYIDADLYNPTAAPISVEVRITVDGVAFGVPVAETLNVPAKSGATNGHSFVDRFASIAKGHHKARLFLDGQLAAQVEFDVN